MAPKERPVTLQEGRVYRDDLQGRLWRVLSWENAIYIFVEDVFTQEQVWAGHLSFTTPALAPLEVLALAAQHPEAQQR